jgi:polyisoprenoid-binding protein YceI
MLYSIVILLLFAFVLLLQKESVRKKQETLIFIFIPFLPFILFFETFLKGENLLFVVNISFVLLTILVSFSKRLKKLYVPFFSLCLFNLSTYLLITNNISFNDFELEVTQPTIYLISFLPFLHLLLVDVLQKKTWGKLISDFLLLFGFGLVVFLSFFVANIFGSYLITTVYLLCGLFFQNFDYRLKFVPLALFICQTVFSTLLDSELLLFNGDVLFGLFTGLGIGLLTTETVDGHRSFKVMILKACFFFSIFFSFYYLGTQKTDLGGVDTCFSLLLGVLLGAFFKSKVSDFKLNLSFVFVGLSFLLLLHESFELKGEKESELKIGSKETNPEVKQKIYSMVDHGMSIDTLSGTWLSDDENSSLEFELGPKGGVTKGIFRALKVQLKNAESLTLNVQLEAKDLTTKNRSRDQSIYEEGYLNIDKFPAMSYSSNAFVKRGDSYIIQGDFEMLGVKRRVDLNSKVTLYTNNELILIGEGELDRSSFGMTPDSKEGNLVSFRFTVRFKKSMLKIEFPKV